MPVPLLMYFSAYCCCLYFALGFALLLCILLVFHSFPCVLFFSYLELLFLPYTSTLHLVFLGSESVLADGMGGLFESVGPSVCVEVITLPRWISEIGVTRRETVTMA
jgi:hypothetical protein